MRMFFLSDHLGLDNQLENSSLGKADFPTLCSGDGGGRKEKKRREVGWECLMPR